MNHHDRKRSLFRVCNECVTGPAYSYHHTCANEALSQSSGDRADPFQTNAQHARTQQLPPDRRGVAFVPTKVAVSGESSERERGQNYPIVSIQQTSRCFLTSFFEEPTPRSLGGEYKAPIACRWNIEGRVFFLFFFQHAQTLV